MKPNRQTTFGQGDDGVYSATSSNSWGPRIEGQEYTDWAGVKRNMSYYDNIDSYFNTGVNTTESFSLSQMYNKTSVYASVTRMDDANKIPSSKLHRTNMTLRTATTFGKDDRWSFDGKIQYINSIAKTVLHRVLMEVLSYQCIQLLYLWILQILKIAWMKMEICVGGKEIAA